MSRDDRDERSLGAIFGLSLGKSWGLRLVVGGVGAWLVYVSVEGAEERPYEALIVGFLLTAVFLLNLADGSWRFAVSPEYRQDRANLRAIFPILRRPVAVCLVILGSGIATTGAVEGQGQSAGLGVMLMVTGGFLGGWGRTLNR